jgi:kynureninase
VTDFEATRARFILPPGQVYLDGNSLGPLPVGAAAATRRCLEDEWGVMAIGGWNRADWMGLPDRLGDRIGALVGAGVGTSPWATPCRSGCSRRLAPPWR